MLKIKKSCLSKYNGKNGSPSYIAYKNKIYNVSNSFLWNGGKHQVVHYSGRDLTNELKKAPHGEDLLKRVPEVGILIDD